MVYADLSDFLIKVCGRQRVFTLFILLREFGFKGDCLSSI